MMSNGTVIVSDEFGITWKVSVAYFNVNLLTQHSSEGTEVTKTQNTLPDLKS
jgi:hypothetical protein